MDRLQCVRVLFFCIGVHLFTACGSDSSSDANPSDPVVTPESLPIVAIEAKLPAIAAFVRITANALFFHPSDGIAQTDWIDFYQYGIYRVAAANSNQLSPELLRELFAKNAPALRFNETPTNELLDPNARYRMWHNDGYSDPLSTRASTHSRERVLIQGSSWGSEEWHPIALTTRYHDSGIDVEQPLLLRTAGNTTLPASSAFVVPPQWRLSNDGNNLYTCLALAAKTWAAVEHFFPYFNVVDVDWSAELMPLLHSCVEADQRANRLQLALKLALTKLGDNHVALVVPGADFPFYSPDLGLCEVESKALFCYVGPAYSQLRVGDELLTIDGVSVAESIQQNLATSLRSTQQARTKAVNGLLFRTSVTTLMISVRRSDGEVISQNVITDNAYYNAEYASLLYYDQISENADVHRVLTNDIHYVNLSLLTSDKVTEVIEKLRSAKAIVIDLRTYPKGRAAWGTFLTHFSSNEIHSLPLYAFEPTAPNHQHDVRRRIVQSMPAQMPLFDVPTVVLSSRYSISQNEHALGFAQSAGLPILGEVTYGINGDITYVYAKRDNGQATWMLLFTGLEVRQHDDSRLIGVGIQPDIVVNRSIAGIRDGRDELRDAAIAYLRARLP